jgi:DNA-binding CsgD family transcriptional regulator
VCVARAVVAQARGDIEALRSATAPLLDGTVPPIIEGQDLGMWQVLAIEGLLGSGELDSARERLADFAEFIETRGLWSPRTDLARLEGQLAEATDGPDAALAVYAAGLRPVTDREPLPLPAARLSLAYGSLLRRTGARRAAIERLREAHATLAALGAAPFLEMCKTELTACGLATPAADRSDALQLTPAEESVAHLVAQGLTNREAATRLYVSPKTVDYHLGNIYAKLGITSRRQLPGRLST